LKPARIGVVVLLTALIKDLPDADALTFRDLHHFAGFPTSTWNRTNPGNFHS
jgi:hypothetical protein